MKLMNNNDHKRRLSSALTASLHAVPGGQFSVKGSEMAIVHPQPNTGLPKEGCVQIPQTASMIRHR
jgi:hypothetical protein